MATLTGFMKGILCCKCLPLSTSLMALHALFARGFTLFPGVVAFQTVDLQCFTMLLMSECDFPHRSVKDDFVFGSESTRNHQTGKHKTYKDYHTKQPFLHLFSIPPFLGIFR
jgi:hypothetical protein